METNPFRAQREAGKPDPGKPDPGKKESGEGDASGAAEDGPGGSTAAPGWPARVHGYVEGCVRGRTWWYRLPVLLVLAWFLHGYVTDPEYVSIFAGVTLGFHEMGHAFFSWFGNRILTAAGGTIFQLAVPAGAALYLLLKQRDPFGATVGTFWLGSSLVEAGRYAADARAQELPLVSPFGPVDAGSHDWTTLLMKFGMLSRDQAIGGALQGCGVAFMALSLVAGGWVLWTMARTAPAPDRVEARIRRPREEAAERNGTEAERLRAFLEREER